VPAFYTQRERQAIIDAAELAGLNVLSLINDHTAGMRIEPYVTIVHLRI